MRTFDYFISNVIYLRKISRRTRHDLLTLNNAEHINFLNVNIYTSFYLKTWRGVILQCWNVILQYLLRLASSRIVISHLVISSKKNR